MGVPETVAERVRRIRGHWAALAAEVAAGELPPEALAERAARDPTAAACRILPLVEALPGMTKVTARRVLAGAGIAGHSVLGQLTADDLDRLRAGVDAVRAGRVPPRAAPVTGGADGAAPASGTEPLDGRRIIVISGPGGVGKGTLVERLLEADDGLWLSRSWTTRQRRPGEAPDAYHFVDRPTFEEAVRQGRFLEWVEFLDYLQGTPVPDPPPGRDVVLEIDVHGARQIRERYPDALLIFVDAPTRADQEARLRGRGDPDDRVRARLAKADEEAAVARSLGAHTIVNDDLDRALAELRDLIAAHRGGRDPGGSRDRGEGGGAGTTGGS